MTRKRAAEWMPKDGERVQTRWGSLRQPNEQFGTVLRRVGRYRQWMVRWDSGRISGVWLTDLRRVHENTRPEVAP